MVTVPSPSYSSTLRWSLWALITMALSIYINKPLQNPHATQGIISYELAYTPQRSHEILASWGMVSTVPPSYARLLQLASFGLGFDFLFLCSYSTAIAYACFYNANVYQQQQQQQQNASSSSSSSSSTSSSISKAFITFSRCIGFGAWIAAMFDSVENVGLLVQLFNGPQQTWAAVAGVSATIKFTLVIIGLLNFIVLRTLIMISSSSRRSPKYANLDSTTMMSSNNKH
eukprot:TRINITY_DN7624_c0_g1_i2.p1 TRINITY_DN7624_c0_g1~~TRINITY_DN7624_c0_g1_i2.p1  ORF type:complete len:229 (+),score=78.63 TRINITY_DN7624_c0_g1_i2:13-699(+)